MKVQHIAAIAGAALGITIAIIGGIAESVQPGFIILRVFLLALIGAGLFVAALALARRYLPGLADDPAIIGGADGSQDELGATVDISVGEDGDLGDDQAANLRAMRSRSRDDYNPDDDAGSDMIEEVSEDAVIGGAVDAVEGFSEEAFYSGISELPDIGGFAENFGGGAGAEGAGSPGGEGAETLFGPASTDGISVSSSRQSGSSKGGVDPKLMAQAISSALKKDHS